MHVSKFTHLSWFNLSLDLFWHLISRHDWGQEAFTFTLEGRAEALWTTDQEPDHQVGILFNRLTCWQGNGQFQNSQKLCDYEIRLASAQSLIL